MAHSSDYYEGLPADLDSLSISSQEDINLSSETFTNLVKSLASDSNEPLSSLLSSTSLDTQYQPIQFDSSPYALPSFKLESPQDSRDYDSYTLTDLSAASQSPYYDSAYSDSHSMYADDYTSSSSSGGSPYHPQEEQFPILPGSETSTNLYAGYNQPSTSYDTSYLSPSPDPSLPCLNSQKPKQKRDRKTKEFYENLTPEEKKRREKEKCKLRVQRFRERERRRTESIADELQAEEQRNQNLRQQYAELMRRVPKEKLQLLRNAVTQNATLRAQLGKQNPHLLKFLLSDDAACLR